MIMKRKLKTFISASAASIVAFSALAQDPAAPKTEGTGDASAGLTRAARADRLNGAAKASEVIGMTVLGSHDEKFAKVDELAVDLESGRIVQVILSTGGFLNIGDTLRAAPPSVLRYDATNQVVHFISTRETLKTTPSFSMSDWAENSDYTHIAAVYHQYGQDSAFNFVQNPDATGKQDASAANQTMIPASRLGSLQRATKLMGVTVKNLQDEKLGKVENILLDLQSGRIVAVIISSGGFIGIGNELSAVPPAALRFTADRETLQLDISKEALANAPHFKADQWPDFAQPTYADGIYRAYRIAPYFTTNAVADAHNTARNARDRNSGNVTPLDQGNNPADLSTTAQIRKEIIAGKDMSTNAKNVKIITIDGRVTLRGPVNTAEEKRVIGEIADRAVQAANVDNQLEVTLADNHED